MKNECVLLSAYRSGRFPTQTEYPLSASVILHCCPLVIILPTSSGKLSSGYLLEVGGSACSFCLSLSLQPCQVQQEEQHKHQTSTT